MAPPKKKLPTTPVDESLANVTADVNLLEGTEIVQPVRTWDAPGSPNLGRPPVPGRLGALRGDITKEYVSSQPNQWYLNLVRVLPFSIDDITADFGFDLYQRMMYDPIVASSVNTLKAAVLEDGITLRPAVQDEDDPNYDLAVQLANEAQELLDSYDGNNFDDWLWEAADAIWRGHTCTEVTYYIDEALSGRRQYFLKRLAAKPVGSFGFAVDTYKNIIGIMGLIPGIGMPVYSGNIVVSPQDQPNMLPRDKFAVYTHRPRDEDPRGVSILRPIYTPWNLKMQTLPEYAKWLKQFASPTLLGYTAQEAMQIPLVDSDGNPLLGSNGQPLTSQSPEQVMLATLVNVMNGSAATFPFGAKVDPIEMHGMGNPFLFAFRFFNEEIATGIMGQSMTSLSQKYGTQALGGVQQNTFDTTVHQIKAGIQKMFLRDVLRLWVKYNFGPQFMKLCPVPFLGQVEKQDFPGELNALAQGGYTLDPSQFPDIDKRLGMPVRAADWQEKAAEAVGRTTFLTQEGWSGGSAIGQELAGAMSGMEPPDPDAQAAGQQPAPQQGGASPHGSAKQQPGGNKGGSQAKDMAAQAKQARYDERHKRAVAMAADLYAKTGIRIQNVDAAPPSMDDVRQMFGIRG